MNGFYVLSGAILFVMVADALITLYGLSRPQCFVELNPIIRALVSWSSGYTWAVLIIVKIVAWIIMLVAFRVAWERNWQLVEAAMALIIAVYSLALLLSSASIIIVHVAGSCR